MSYQDTVATPKILEQLKKECAEIEFKTHEYSLADAMREGSKATTQKLGGWGEGEMACALSAGILAARARDFL